MECYAFSFQQSSIARSKNVVQMKTVSSEGHQWQIAEEIPCSAFRLTRDTIPAYFIIRSYVAFKKKFACEFYCSISAGSSNERSGLRNKPQFSFLVSVSRSGSVSFLYLATKPKVGLVGLSRRD